METETTEAILIGGPLDGLSFTLLNQVKDGELLRFGRNYHEFTLDVEKEGSYKPLRNAIYELEIGIDRNVLHYVQLE